MPTESDNQAITSSSPATSPNDQKNGCGSKHTTMSHDPTAYVARARVTRPEPPKPSYNPMQFVQIKPCNLFKSAQEQLKRAEEVKKVKEIKKEEPEEWQNNLDNWKSSRRKRVEHIIDRVVEVKKLELEEHDRTRRKSATFSEMLEKRGERGRGINKLASLSVYNEDESNDFSDLGIGASSVSGKSSISEDYDSHSAMTNNDKEDANDDPENNINNNGNSNNDLVINEGGEETNNRDTCEYTYESAIQDYKTRVSRASSNGLFTNNNVYPPTDNNSPSNQIRRSSKIEEKLSSFEGKPTVDDSQTVAKADLPKVDISKRKELFEAQQPSTTSNNSQKRLSGEFTGTKSIKERLSNLEKKPSIEVVEEKKAFGGDVSGIRERLQNVEKPEQIQKVSPVSDVPVPSLKDRLSSLQSAATKEEVKKPVLLVDEQQVELMRKEDEDLLNKQKLEAFDESFSSSQEVLNIDTDREDSGIHTTDVSCSVSQTDEQPEISHINDDTLQEPSSKPETPVNLELSVNDALELALKAIDEEGIINQPDDIEPIYEVIPEDDKVGDVEDIVDEIEQKKPDVKMQIMTVVDSEPYYQVPKPIIEPYYEVPKSKKPIPVYENIEIFFPANGNVLEPPTEKPPPPPPPTDDLDDDGGTDTNDNSLELYENAPMKRINSTKRIKNEIRNKRSSFLGIEGNIDDLEELSLAPPPDMAQLLQEEKRLEKQLYLKAGLYDSSDTGDSRDSGVSENHSRQSSEPFTNSSEEADRHEDLLSKKEKEIIEVLEKEEEKQKRTYENITEIQSSLVDTVDSSKIQSIEDQIREQEEVLRVERELLQLEQEEIKRQRENLMIRENMTRRELQNGAKMFMSANPNHRSLQDINNASSNIYANVPTNQLYQIDVDFRKSISDLRAGPVPPTKPMRTYAGLVPAVPGGGLVKIATNCYPGSIPAHLNYHSAATDQPVPAPIPVRNYQTGGVLQHGNMSRNTLHALSAAPKPKYTDAWVSQKQADKRKSAPNENFNGNYHNHWLIQEAEQRRIEQQRLNQHKRQSLPLQQSINNWSNSNGNTQHHHHHHQPPQPQQQQQHPSQNSTALIQRNGSYDNKPLPESVIQTITQRVQSKGIGERMKRLEARSTECLTSSKQIPPPGGLGQPMKPLNSIVTDNNNLYSHVNHNGSQYSATQHQQPQATATSSISDKVLSVSGKKKCSHCGDELGRGAAMIIESLRLFYHINCFKCCVCHVQLGDGLNGTDVRVRNQKLHCQNCYSSDDGIKFSCV